MDVSSASFAYPRLDGPARARVAEALLGASIPAGVFVLSTCLRVEVLTLGDEVALKERLGEIFGSSPAEPEVRTGLASVEHVFRVAGGLESPILGEMEVLTQFRKALADIKERGPLPGSFSKLLESAVATGREVREALGTSPHDTMAALAAQMVGAASRVAVVGSGTMAKAVVTALGGLPAPPRITIVARRPDTVAGGQGDRLPMGSLDDVLAEFPAVVSATAASSRLIDEGRLREALGRRTERLTLVDMAMPPDFAAPSGERVEYIGIDDLARAAVRRGRTSGMDEVVARAAAEAHHRLTDQGEAGPAIAAIVAHADAVVEEAVERFAGRLREESDREVLRQAAHTVARTLIDGPVAAVRTARDPKVVETITSVFEDE